MSTTITYKGSTLTTVDNETKKLDTAGTWLEDDIIIIDETPDPSTVTVDIQLYQDENGYIVLGDSVIPNAVGVSF